MRKRSLYHLLSWVVAAFLIFWIGMFRAADAPENKTRATWTETCTWIGATGGTWSTGSNWNCNGSNRVPTATDQVVIDANVTVNISATTTIDDLVLGDVSGTYAPVLNFTYDAISSGALVIDESNAIIHPNAQVTHSAGTTAVVGRVFIDVQSGDLTINGSINADAKGYAASEGTGQGTNGNGAGGAGYGGEGGNDAYAGTAGGITYGSLTAPTDLGSGGGIDGVGAKGGGSVKLTVSGTTTVAGNITAKGQTNPGTSTQDAGGGSGGSVYLTTGTLAGSGTISVNGTDAYRYGGAGGGGRIAVYYTTDSSSITYQAFGGALGSAGGNIAAAGTIYKKPSSGDGSVIVDNTNRDAGIKKTGALPASGTFSSLTVTNFARLHLSTSTTITTITLSNSGTLQIESGYTTTYTTFAWSTGGKVIDRGGAFSLFSGGGALTVPSTTTLYADTSRSYTNVTIDGTVTHTPNTTAETYKIDHTASGNYTISAGGTINVDGGGFSANSGTGKGTGGNGGGGGGYGGEGGDGAVGGGGSTYGSMTQPTNIGSGGGLDTATSNGKGGGAVKLNVSGVLTINGPISASGTAAITGTNDTGGGSGGSIYLIAGTLEGSSTLTANGGGGGNAGQYGGSGGGGRIALYYTTDNSTIAKFAKSGTTNGPTYVTGGAGTIYTESTGGTKTVTLDNGNLESNNNFTYIPASISVATLTITQKANLKYNVTGVTATTVSLTSSGIFQLESGSSITYTNFTWSTSAVFIDRGGTFSLFSGGGALTVPTSTILYADTARNYTSVTVDGTISHSSNTTAETYTLNHTASGNYTISSSGAINVNAKGYSPGYGPGVGTAANGAGGGGYGGEGGDGTAGAGGTPYGSVTAPVNIGSGGGLDGTSTQGGGGAIKLTVSGIVTINGSVSADGGTALTGTSDIGGGSGGSVYIIAATLSGSGTITANGGGGGNAGQQAGAGGGGRISLNYTTDSSTITVTAKSGPTNGPTWVTGAAGTVYRETTGGVRTLVLDNGSIDYNDNYTNLPAGFSLDSLTINNKGSLKSVTSTVTATAITLSNSSAIRTEVGGNLAYSNLSWESSSSIIDRGGTFAVVSGGGNLTVPATTTYIADTARTFSSLTVNGTITHTENTTAETYKVDLSATGDITVSGTGSINVSYKGYQYSEGPGQGGDSGSGSGGGGYGGAGGNGLGASGGAAYGSATNPVNIGSGGGNQTAGNGGAGGGAIILTAGGTTTISGSLVANGKNHIVNAGGGSGGTINITTGTFTGGGTVYALGGTGDAGISGGGGGGRIAIAYSGWGWTGNTLTDAVATAGGTGKNAGAVGTVYLYSSNNLPVASGTMIDAGAAAIDLTAGSSTSVSCTATVADLDGYLDITTVTGRLFRTGVGYGAADDSNNHYTTTCTGGSGSGTTRPYTCNFDVWFHAEGTDASSSYSTDTWTCRITPNDADGEGTSDTDTVEMNSIAAVSMSSNIVFSSSYAPGTNSGASNEAIEVYNVGNLPIDVEISGTALCTNFPTCTGATIAVGNIEHYDSAFVYNAGIDLTSSPVLNSYNIVRSTIHPSTQYRTVYWGIGVPALTTGGGYTGQVNFTAVQH